MVCFSERRCARCAVGGSSWCCSAPRSPCPHLHGHPHPDPHPRPGTGQLEAPLAGVAAAPSRSFHHQRSSRSDAKSVWRLPNRGAARRLLIRGSSFSADPSWLVPLAAVTGVCIHRRSLALGNPQPASRVRQPGSESDGRAHRRRHGMTLEGRSNAGQLVTTWIWMDVLLRRRSVGGQAHHAMASNAAACGRRSRPVAESPSQVMSGEAEPVGATLVPRVFSRCQRRVMAMTSSIHCPQRGLLEKLCRQK